MTQTFSSDNKKLTVRLNYSTIAIMLIALNTYTIQNIENARIAIKILSCNGCLVL
jgi:hypothetical protein